MSNWIYITLILVAFGNGMVFYSGIQNGISQYNLFGKIVFLVFIPVIGSFVVVILVIADLLYRLGCFIAERMLFRFWYRRFCSRYYEDMEEKVFEEMISRSEIYYVGLRHNNKRLRVNDKVRWSLLLGIRKIRPHKCFGWMDDNSLRYRN
jgi:hypothetical protein